MTLPLPIPDVLDSNEKWDEYERRLTPDELDELDSYLEAILKMDDATLQQLKEDRLEENRRIQMERNRLNQKVAKAIDDGREKERMKLWVNVRKQKLQERLHRGNVEGQTKLFAESEKEGA